jgi:dephospho-CoA kinase
MEEVERMPLIIGITGSIATGKSTACEYMLRQGAAYCDADKLVHTLYEPGKPAFDRIIETFGRDVVGRDGFIDRRALGARVFGNPDEMAKLTAAIGDIAGAVRQVIESWRATLGRYDVAVLEAVNFVEAGYGQWCDLVWLFACNPAIARQRLMQRSNLTPEEADRRLASQRGWEDRAAAVDCVIFNDNTEQDLIGQIASEFEHVKSEWADGGLAPSRYLNWWQHRQSHQKQQTPL